MSKKILIDAVYSGETRVVIYDNNTIQDFDYENAHKKQLKGNIYLAKITRVEPSLQAAFVEYGGNKQGFLPFDEIHPCYFMQGVENFAEEENGASIADKLPAVVLSEVNEEENSTSIIAEVNTDLVVEKSSEEAAIVTGQVEENKSQQDISNDFSDHIEDEEPHPHDTIHQKYKIQDVIKKGQALLIQVIKEERGNKGAACTSYISLAGRYCVFMPNSDKQGGISRRIVDPADRKYLKDVITHLNIPQGISIILRTAGKGRNFNDIRRDYYYLARLWNAIREHAIKAPVNSFIHAESDLLKRTIRDLYSSEISEIIIQGNESYKTAKEFMKKILPIHANKIKEYKAKTPIFIKYNIEDKISSLFNPIVKLPSGGYIVINPTEALISIDVNSGKSTNERNIEETAVKTNLEAAKEIARQLRLRDMSGLIVIDFIDMIEPSNRKSVERTVRDSFVTDRAKVQLGNISAFGLMELSRQRLQSSFLEANTIACPACNGRGYIKSFGANGLFILRTIENEIYQGDCEKLDVFAHQDVILNLLNERRDALTNLEKQYDCKVIFHKEDTVHYDSFSIEKTTKGKNLHKNISPTLDDDIHMDSYDQEFNNDMIINKSQLELESQIAPYQVNDNSILNEKATSTIRHQVRKGKNFRRKNKINRDSTVEQEENLINPREDNLNQTKRFNKHKGNNRFRRQGRHSFAKENNRKHNDGESSVLKKLWNKLTS